MKRKLVLILSIVLIGTALIATLRPSVIFLMCLLIIIFMIIYYVPIFHDFASMYALLLSYIFGFIPISRIIFNNLSKQGIIGNNSSISNIGQFILSLGITLLLLHFISLVCSIVAAFLWPRQKTLILK